MSKNKGGRPPKYQYDLLLKELTKFVDTKGKMKIISNKALEEFSGIPSHIWRDNEKIQIDIQRYSLSLVIKESSQELTKLPNPVELVEASWPNKNRLVEKLRGYMDYVSSIWEKAIKYDEVEKKHLQAEREIKKLKDDIESLTELNKMYKSSLQHYAINSRSLLKRKELGIERNLLVIAGNSKFAGGTIKELSHHLEQVTNIEKEIADSIDINSPEFEDLWKKH